MIIDCHAHVYASPRLIPAAGATPFMSAEDQIALMDKKGVDKAVILPLNNAETPAEHQSAAEVLGICERYPGRFIPFCNFDPRLPRRPANAVADDYHFLARQYKALGFRGYGELTARMPFDDPLLLLLFEALQEVGFPVTFHTITEDVNSYGLIDEVGLPRFESVLKRFPRLSFFGHSPGFWSEISGAVTVAEKAGYPAGPVQPGGRLPHLFRTYPQLYGDISAGSGFNAFARDPEHAWKFLEEFQDRILLGLDYCSPRNDMKHIEWLTQACAEGHISKQVYEKVMGGNLERVLGLALAG